MTQTKDDQPSHRYSASMAQEIETRWQGYWDQHGTYRIPNPGEPGFDASRPKFFCLDMFPYPSGAGLHVGHPEGYTATDIISRYKRMKGFNVLHPMGWDAFGLPAEQYAIQTGIHPSITTRKAIDTFRRQLQRFGFSYDWSREIATIDEDYYRWTQWIFLQIYNAWYDAAADGGRGRARPLKDLVHELEQGRVGISPTGDLVRIAGLPAAIGGEPVGVRLWHELTNEDRRAFIDDHRLAYLNEQTVNWCPKLGTVLANEEVIDGKSERGGYPVYRRTLKQWMFRITAYAQRLLDDLAGLDWPESTRTMQTEWIGRSEGAEIEFDLELGLGTPTVPVGIRDFADALYEHRIRHLRPEGFVGRDPYPPGMYGAVDDLIRSKRNLPHFELAGATYFVSWRAMDGVNLSEEARTIALEGLRHFDGDRAQVFAAVVMPDHIHWVVKPLGVHRIGELCESVKEFTARKINRLQGRKGALWEPEQFDHIIRDEKFLVEFMRYVVANPVKEGLVDTASGYKWLFVHPTVVAGSFPHTESEPDRDGRGTQTIGGFTSITVYTTRPDTVFGATYMVVAPEHPLVEAILSSPAQARAGASIDEIGRYVSAARNKADVDRMADAKEKTGVFTGIHAFNPATGQRIPIWIADYVLMGVGHGAIMAVPAHDQRDFEFATKFGLPIRDVVYPRVIAAMNHFAEHAEDHHKLPEAWTTVLADLLGYVTSTATPPEKFQEALDLVSKRRRAGEALAVDVNPRIAMEEQSREAPERRGLTRLVWLDFIEQQGFSTYASLKERLSAARFQEEEGAAFSGPGFAVNSANREISLNNLSTEKAKERIIAWLEEKGLGRRKTNFKLRDWLFSRQRYWGEPFPIVYDAAGDHYPIGDASLPVKLPQMQQYKPPESDEPAPMLAAATEWLNTTAGAAGVSPDLLPPGTPVRRETNTMPNWAGSCWYYLRFCDPKNGKSFVGREAERYWMGDSSVDLYIGGSEHAVLHLLYARFWHKCLFDLGHVSTSEPMRKLFHQGLITSYAYQDAEKRVVPVDEVEERDGKFVLKTTGAPVQQIVAKMAKSLKNVVNPDDVIAEYGADTMRLYEMYMGPLDASKPWNPRDITGCYRFLQRAWRMIIDENTGRPNLVGAIDQGIERQLHRLNARLGQDIERLGFNVAIAAMMEFVKAASPGEGKAMLTQAQAERFTLLLAPFAPHIAEELWQRLGHTSSVALESWPRHDESMLVDSHVEIPIQIMGKVRGHITVPAGADAKTIEAAALAEPRVKALVEGKTIKKVIVVPGKLVNIVAG